MDELSQYVPVILAQQASKPNHDRDDAFKRGEGVGRFVGYVMIAVVAVWVVLKMFNRPSPPKE